MCDVLPCAQYSPLARLSSSQSTKVRRLNHLVAAAHRVVAGGLSQVQVGLLITPWPAVIMIVAPLSGRLSDRYPAGLLGGLGLAVLTAGLLLMLALPPDAAFPRGSRGKRLAAWWWRCRLL